MADECYRCPSWINGKCTEKESKFYQTYTSSDTACDQFGFDEDAI